MAGKLLAYIANVRLPTEKAHGYQIMQMCEAFSQEGEQVTLYHPFRRQPPELEGVSAFHYYDVTPCFEVSTLRNWDVLRLPRRLHRFLFLGQALLWGYYAARTAASKGADVYYTRDVPVAYWLSRLSLPAVYEAHVFPAGRERRLLRSTVQSAHLHLVVALTTFIGQRLTSLGLTSNRISVHPDGVDLRRFESLPLSRSCRQQLGLPLERPIVGYLGRFQALGMEKGVPDLLEAMARAPRVNGQEPHLLCIGGPMDAVPAYRQLMERLGLPENRVSFVDRVPNAKVPLWLRTFDVAVLPLPKTEFHAYFTSPLKLFEYMAAGLPIVGTDFPSTREILRHNENAWLVPVKDAGELAAGIAKLLKERSVSSRLASQARLEVQAYTWQSRARQILGRLRAQR